ncbi:hypothetical protein HMPREF0372_03084 [Flavonifractor plautii ATCC 29863]|uniref:Uncharacterized protein n=1 Tax=Flavonifractor plautii ATCC 29863 TaxID=411475 RepID=G9YU70_FLAPL|nr:hypothetical protein HMPREF0372_03084 [Flavonifractor plautii ATCC 29863]
MRKCTACRSGRHLARAIFRMTDAPCIAKAPQTETNLRRMCTQKL